MSEKMSGHHRSRTVVLRPNGRAAATITDRPAVQSSDIPLSTRAREFYGNGPVRRTIGKGTWFNDSI